MSLELLGAEQDKKAAAAAAATGGYGAVLGPILQAAGELAQGGIAMYEQNEAKKKAESDKLEASRKSEEDQRKRLAAVIAADRNAANAIARAAVSVELKSPSAANDAAVAAVAERTQERASAQLSEDSVQKRVEAAEKALDAAVMVSQKAPKDNLKRALVAAWTKVVNKATASQIIVSDPTRGAMEESSSGARKSWLTRPIVGPVPGWGVIGGVGLLGVLGTVLARRMG